MGKGGNGRTDCGKPYCASSAVGKGGFTDCRKTYIVLHWWKRVVALIVESHIVLHWWKRVVVLIVENRIGGGDGEEGGRQLNCVADQLIFSSLNLF